MRGRRDSRTDSSAQALMTGVRLGQSDGRTLAVPKGSRMHHADEFGRVASNKLTGADAPSIGAASMIAVDGIVENESGVTPPPPPISVKAIAIGLVVMFLVGLILLSVAMRLPAERGDSHTSPPTPQERAKP